jgi:hypothetical protein
MNPSTAGGIRAPRPGARTARHESGMMLCDGEDDDEERCVRFAA